MRLSIINEYLIREAPHVRFLRSSVPDSLAFLRGELVDLGFENLGLDVDRFSSVASAFIGDGVGIPGTGLKMRKDSRGVAVVVPDDGVSVFLPENWREGVWVLGSDDKPSYVGSLVRDDQV